jgi:hypothetical protein
VQTLTSQLEEARRQLGQSFRAHAVSPGSREFTQLQAENAYLRDENADLRRQLYSHRVNYGHMPPPSGPGGEQAKAEPGNGFGMPYGTDSPRGEPVRRSGDYVSRSLFVAFLQYLSSQFSQERQPNGEGGSSAPSSTSSYPPHVDQFAPIDHRNRRVLSAGSVSCHLHRHNIADHPRYRILLHTSHLTLVPSRIATPLHAMSQCTLALLKVLHHRTTCQGLLACTSLTCTLQEKRVEVATTQLGLEK